MKLRFIIIFLMLIPCFIFAQRAYIPWYTGPLIADDGANLDKGLVNIQPYLYFRDTPGVYSKAWGHHAEASSFTFHAQLGLQFGITTWLDCTLYGQTFYKEKEGKDDFDIGDTGVKFGLQFLRGEDFRDIPYIRLTIQENFPTGRYNNINPSKSSIGSTGSGSYETIFDFILEKTVYWFESHPISWRFNSSYTYSSKVSVKNFNVYGGGFGTRGKVSPGGVFKEILAFEFSFTQKWVLAMDTVYVYASKTTFSGHAGTTSEGRVASNSHSKSHQTSLAPAIEYNFSKNLGILAGYHFAISSKNATKFKSGIITATYTF